ncbi:aspartate aminotransferase family protein [Marinimicrococcus flavescens]|uniref:Aspartate aminotransferase family protein n=1 Tax=Marinimicrococcus flavescens TaxID=3031815 RepID=A0AAP3UXE7_9PROT|nr:aspartate aminotransferase family protein [Marinimicrococcus flavescens]
MSHVLHRAARAKPPTAVRAQGLVIEDKEGRRYLDASGGAAVSCLGHGHPRVVEAVRHQAGTLAFAHTGFFTSEPAEQLADLLIGQAPAGIDQVYFTCGGSESVEAALKLARQYFVETGQPQRRHFIARRQSYHGNTLGALAVGGNMWRREPYAPLLMEAHHVAPCFAYRFKEEAESEEAYGARLADELEAKIRELGPETVAAFVAETVVGATAGAVPPVAGYFRRVREVCDRHGVLLILDEVMSGMGRTGTLHACEQEGIAPDIMTIAKGLGAGYQPIGAVLFSRRIMEALLAGSGAFMHGHTYNGHPVACAAGVAVLETLREENLLENVRAMGELMQSRLDARLGQNPHVGDIRGRGLFRAVELVADRESKACFDPALKLNARIKAEAMQRGLMVYPMGGTVDGRQGDHVLLAPPFIVGPSDVETIVERLGEAVEAALASVQR